MIKDNTICESQNQNNSYNPNNYASSHYHIETSPHHFIIYLLQTPTYGQY